jgi:hypothetical protein
MSRNPFAALNLDARPDLTDAQVRAAWRAIAAATHPDRPDGGNAEVYAAASAAYAVLRTAWGRSEAYADLIARTVPGRPAPAAQPARPAAHTRSALTGLLARVRHGRPVMLAARLLAAALLTAVILHTHAGTGPVTGTITGVLLWLALTVRGDLAPPPGR